MKNKLKLENLKVKSFIINQDDFDSETVKGGVEIPFLTNRCTVLVTQNCPTRFVTNCNQVTIIGCNPNTLFNCDPPPTLGICIRPTAYVFC